jgi:hypothetical protein
MLISYGCVVRLLQELLAPEGLLDDEQAVIVVICLVVVGQGLQGNTLLLSGCLCMQRP